MTAKSIAEKDAMFLPWGKGDAIFPLVGAEDVGRVATALLGSEGLPKQNAYDLIVELPTAIEIANTLTAVLHRPIRYVEITDEQWVQAVRERLNAHALDHLSHLWQFFRESRFRKGEDGVRARRAQAHGGPHEQALPDLSHEQPHHEAEGGGQAAGLGQEAHGSQAGAGTSTRRAAGRVPMASSLDLARFHSPSVS